MTPSLVALLLLIAAGLVVCSALFSGLETALFASPRAISCAASRSIIPPSPALCRSFVKIRAGVLAVILLGSALVNVFSSSFVWLCSGETPRATRLPPWLIARFALRHHRFLLRLNSQACRAFRALSPFRTRRFHSARVNALARNRWEHPGNNQRCHRR